MLNPDGVIHGNYRCSLAGTDLNRRFLDCHNSLHPTIRALRDLVVSMKKSRSVFMYLDLHGHSKKKNSFVYGCDVTLQHDRFDNILSIADQEEDLLQRIYTRVFPYLLESVSCSDTGGFFSYRDCSFKVEKSKQGTGRVVMWSQIGVEASYTIESSFCSNGNNKECKLLKKYFDAKGKGIAFAKAEEVYSTAGSIPSIDSPLVDILKEYKNCRHYSKSDLQSMGRDIGIAIFHFANLSNADLEKEITIAAQAKLTESSIDFSLGMRINKSSDVLLNINDKSIDIERNKSPDLKLKGSDSSVMDDEEEQEDLESDSNDSSRQRSYRRPNRILEHEPTMLNRSLLKPSVFGLESLQAIVNNAIASRSSIHLDNVISKRIKSEIEVRHILKCDNGLKNIITKFRKNDSPKGVVKPVEVAIVEEEAVEVHSSDGSDSDPSGDNVSVSKMIKKLGNSKDTSSLMRSLKAEMLKKRKKEMEEKISRDKINKKNREKQLKAIPAKKVSIYYKIMYIICIIYIFNNDCH